MAVRRIRRRDGERRYWAFLANPTIYDIEAAVEKFDTDLWTTKGSDVRAGDRVVIWKARGRDAYRGVVALAEVLSDPQIRLDDSPCWAKAEDGAVPEERVEVRYVRPPGLPLWLGSDPSGVLASLSVSRGRGRSVFKVSEDQWEGLIALVGGWPEL